MKYKKGNADKKVAYDDDDDKDTSKRKRKEREEHEDVVASGHLLVLSITP